MKTYIGADHRGFKLKETLKSFLIERGDEVIDVGNNHYDPNDDYPDFAATVAKEVAKDLVGSRGILICGSGVGVDVVANKFKGVRSALIFNPEQAYSSRNDDDANILSLAADFLTPKEAEKIVHIWLQTPFSENERYKRRLEKFSGLGI